jgi:hypothetical protein
MPAATRIRSGSQGYSYWLSIAWSGNSINQARDLTSDGLGNFYAAADIPSLTGGTRDIVVLKFDKNGASVWRRLYGGVGYNASKEIRVLPNGDVLVCAVTESSHCLLSVISPSGSLQWQKKYSSSDQSVPEGVAVDSSGNIYMCGYTRTGVGAVYELFVAKLDQAGAILWQRKLTNAADAFATSIAVDSADNAFVVGEYIASSRSFLIAKYNPSGVLQWQRSLASARDSYGRSVRVDATGNLYACGYTQQLGASTYDMGLVVKYDTNGAVIWQRTLSGSIDVLARKLALSASGDVFIAGRKIVPGTGQADVIAAKFDASGILQWQREMVASTTDYDGGISSDPVGELGLFFYSNSFGSTNNYRLVLARLPQDGSLTGVYPPFTYQASTFVDAIGVLTPGTPSLSDGPHALTEVASALTFYSLSLNRSSIPIL